jgi:hypothetical protein
MFPRRWLDAETIDDWRRQLVGGARPTALALGLLEAQEPALLEHEPNPARHLCLAHFLLDGHHRVAASAQAAKPVTILSFLSLDESGAPADEVDAALAALTG